MKKLLGDRAFYRAVLTLVIPVMIQTGVTNFVNLLDNIMVGQLGTEPMSGVSIANQLITIYNLAIFGTVSGAGIFGAQYFGKGDHEGARDSFRFKVVCCLLLSAAACAVIFFGRNFLIHLYLKDGGEAVGSLEVTYSYAERYMRVMLIGLFPFAVSQSYSTSLREYNETLLPMLASSAAVLVNLTGNFLLIYGMFGFPELGVVGAAIATVISRFVESAILLIFTHTRSERFRFIRGAYLGLLLPVRIWVPMLKTAFPLICNETMFSMAMAVLLMNYSERGLIAVAASNIISTVQNLFAICFSGFGTAISVMIGQELGAGKLARAKEDVWKLLFCDVASNFLVGVVIAAAAPLFPRLYNTAGSVRELAASMLRVMGCFFPVQACMHACYFIIRSGGNTVITFFFDSGFLWGIAIPVSWILVHATDMGVLSVYLVIQGLDAIKAAVGLAMVRSGIWAKQIVTNDDPAKEN